MNRTLLGIIIVALLTAGLIPFGLIALSRSRTSTVPPVQIIQDMAKQQKFKTQRVNPMFADDRAMRPAVPGTVARRDLIVENQVLNDPHHPRMIGGRSESFTLDNQDEYGRIVEGIERTSDGKTEYVTRIPLPVNMDMMRRGREQFNIYCAPCHGADGYGDGIIAKRAAEMQAAGADTAAGWVAPPNYHTDEIRNRPLGNIYNTITNGIRTMPAYDKQIEVLDRWAVTAYVKALQRSQNAQADDVPETEKYNFAK